MIDGREVRAYPRLAFGGAHLENPAQEWKADLWLRSLRGVIGGLVVASLVVFLVAAVRGRQAGGWRACRRDSPRRDRNPMALGPPDGSGGRHGDRLAGGDLAYYHPFGTDRTGNDVLYQALKSIRTAVVIGSLSTIATLPLAIALGVLAGYFKGWIDDVIQYFYTVLSAIPPILLVAAFVLLINVYIDKNAESFATGVERAEFRLFLLCVILGITGWATLCRLLRAETLKISELEYVQAAHAFGVSHGRIMWRHILPNVMHLVLIVAVLDFSALVLYEARARRTSA